jgi:hypothetical protein
VGPVTDPDDVERRNSFPYRDSNSDPSVVQPIATSRLYQFRKKTKQE